MKSEIQPRKLLREIGRRWPNAWTQIKGLRAARGDGLPMWPDWCYMPISGGIAVASGGGDVLKMPLPERFDITIWANRIAAAAAWRVSQGVYRYDADLYNALIDQPVDGDLPCDALKRLPEWCVYIECLPGHKLYGIIDIAGFFAHLEWDANTGREELRLLLVSDRGEYMPIPIHIGPWTLQEAIQKYLDVSAASAAGFDVTKFVPQAGAAAVAADVAPLINLVLYLCADNADMQRPEHPSRRARMGGGIDAPKEPRVWDVGIRIGSAIRTYNNTQPAQTNTRPADTHATPRPHIRRAHWHHFWTGPREGDREIIIRWLPPIPVNAIPDDDGPVVIHRVRRG